MSRVASDLLQRNHDYFDIYFNDIGFHNHIAHHILTTYALAASPDLLKRHFDLNKSYQREPRAVDLRVVSEMNDKSKFREHLGDERHYSNYLLFFRNKISESDWEAVVNRFVLKNDDLANDMLSRMYDSFLHPIIHVGFGVEFGQPAIVAEGLALTATHKNTLYPIFEATERAAGRNRKAPSKTMTELLEAISTDADIHGTVERPQVDEIYSNVVGRAAEKLIGYLSQYHVRELELEQKTAETTHAAAYMTGCAQRPGHVVKLDFFFLHSVTCSIFFSTFLGQPWITDADKARLLERKVWHDLLLFASLGSPNLDIQVVRDYIPTRPGGWEEIFERVRRVTDDGHASKLIRALANGQHLSIGDIKKEGLPLTNDDWLRMAHMSLDSLETGGPLWIKGASFPEAWQSVPRQSRSRSAIESDF
jgi:hypothetical protein